MHSLADLARHHEAHAAQGGSLKTIKLGGVLRTPLAIGNGFATTPSGPGLGIEVDEARVRKYSLKL